MASLVFDLPSMPSLAPRFFIELPIQPGETSIHPISLNELFHQYPALAEAARLIDGDRVLTAEVLSDVGLRVGIMQSVRQRVAALKINGARFVVTFNGVGSGDYDSIAQGVNIRDLSLLDAQDKLSKSGIRTVGGEHFASPRQVRLQPYAGDRVPRRESGGYFAIEDSRFSSSVASELIFPHRRS